MRALSTRCCIVGGGPAGMMAGLLLARAGVDIIVLEKHADFLRDFRGDTVHPSTMEVMSELGVLDAFLERPHQKLRQTMGEVDGTRVIISDFSRLKVACPFIAMMPQWDFLDFLADQARRYPTFRLLMNAEVTDLLRCPPSVPAGARNEKADGGPVTGVRARTADGDLEIEASLTIGADGRDSVVRERAGLVVETLGAPIDVLWMRISRRDSDPADVLGVVRAGRVLVMLNRGDYWQCAFAIPKGGYAALQERGLEAFRSDVASMATFLGDRVAGLRTWDDIRLLTVKVDRLRQWHAPGLLCIGDAAHAMSPVGGVGINLAVQDAVAAANLLYQPLLNGRVTSAHLTAVQRRRLLPTRMTQAAQVAIQNNALAPLLRQDRNSSVGLPFPIRMLQRFPALRRIPARLVGVGVRPEHVRTPDAFAGSAMAGYN